MRRIRKSIQDRIWLDIGSASLVSGAHNSLRKQGRLLLNTEDPTFFDVTPYLRLFIDKDGKWYQNGVEIIHPGVLRQFMEALETDSDNHYRIKIGKEVCSVEVEDTPFVVTGVSEDKDGNLLLLLNDGTLEIFNPETFRINDSNIPYSVVRNGKFPARFSRPAYYQFADRLDFDDREQTYFMSLNGKKVIIKTPEKN